MSQDLRNYALSVLDDDYEINEAAWEMLHELLQGSGELELARLVRATDGRYRRWKVLYQVEMGALK